MSNKKVFVGILCNENEDDHIPWIKACDHFPQQIEYRLINFTGCNWWEEITARHFDWFLAKPSGISSSFKQLYDERIHIMAGLGMQIFPTPQEIYIYENKRYFYSWLRAHKLPHPVTKVCYHKHEADSFVGNAIYPLVAKTNIGASGSGVAMIKNKQEAQEYILASFSDKGAPKRWGPNMSKGNWLKRGFHYVLHPGEIKKKMDVYQAKRMERQKGFVLLQEHVPHDFEWRIVVIGDSYFAHKKLKLGEKASGSLLKNYDNPPVHLFDFAKSIVDRFAFKSQAIDLFEKSNGELIINEMQCIFGQSDPFQMMVDNRPGRYRFLDDRWIFEEGDFNQNQSYNLRLEYLLSAVNS